MLKKSNIYGIIFFVFLGVQGFSQVHFGAKLGGSSSSFMGISNTVITKFVSQQSTSFHGGGIVKFEISKHFGLQTELLYSAKGAPISFTSANSLYNGDVTFNQKLGYFSIPILFQLNFGSNARSNFHFDLGVIPNWLVYNKFNGTLNYIDNNNNPKSTSFTQTLNLNKQDFGFAFGLGLLANGIMFDFRYEVDRKSVYSVTEGIPDIKNRTFFVSLGYLFN